MNHPKRLIEVDLPIKRISAHARREKSIRHGHISTLHIWWARRPLAACRAVICAALWFDPADEKCPPEFREVVRKQMREWAMKHRGLMSAESYEHFEAVRKNLALLDDNGMLRTLLLDFIADFANWDNTTRAEYLETSRALTQAAHVATGGEPGTRPLVVDPFAGGGAIPLEALRVGADAYASDLNPVAILLNKVELEFIPKYGQRLADEVRKWAKWIKESAEKELAEFYPKDSDGSTPIAYLWARTIRCEGPGCGLEIPLVRSPWLVRDGRKSIALELSPSPDRTHIEVNIGENIASEKVFATVRRGSATCPSCGYTTPAPNVRAQFANRHGGASDARLLAVVTTKEGVNRRVRLATSTDEMVATSAKLEIERRAEVQTSLSLVPDEPLPYLRSIFNIHLLGANRWGDLFAPRQALALTTLARLVNMVGNKQVAQGNENSDFITAIQTCLALAVDRVADRSSSLTRWDASSNNIGSTFGRQALPIVWDFAEAGPFAQASGDWSGAAEWICKVIEHEAQADYQPGHVEQVAAQDHPLPDDAGTLFFTDPPYYDAIPYADLSDFFYVWMKRSLGGRHSDLFSSNLAPKKQETVQLAERNREYAYKTRENFEQLMQKALERGRQITAPYGIGIIVFAHKTTDAWETMLQAVIDAGWIVTASWPIDTEMSNRMRAIGSAALASSVHLVCRPLENTEGILRADDVGDWRDVLRELPVRIHEWMPRLAKEGVVGADAIFACLGPALEVFSRYSRVEKASGEEVTLREYLEYVWAAVSKEALNMIFAGADATGFEEDARLTAMWLWTLSTGAQPNNGNAGELDSETAETEDSGDEEESSGKAAKTSGFILEYDAARKIAQGLGAHLEELASLVEVKGDKARLLPVAERTKYLFGKEEAEAPTKRKKKDPQAKLFETLEDIEETGGWSNKTAPELGDTVLDRIHQSMILFAAGRGEALRRFLVEDGVGRDERFWRLANALSALYPASGDEKRWVDGVLARKKGLGF